MSPAVSVQNVTLRHNKVAVLQGFSVDIEPSSFTAIIGNNGSGKSTLLRAVSALHDEYTGAILVNGKPLGSFRDPFADGTLSFLGQQHQINFDLNVFQLLLMGRFRFKGAFQSYDQDDRDAVAEVAENIGISHLLEKGFYQLSGGEQQLVMFAQSIVQDASIYLLDEPTQNLDVRNTDYLFALMRQLVEKGKTVVCATHDLHYLPSMSGKMINLSDASPQLIDISSGTVSDAIASLTAAVAQP